MGDKYYVTRLKLTETFSEALRYAVIDDYGKIVMTLDRPLTAEDERHLRFLFTDALSDFQRSRGASAEEYVARLYPEGAGYEWLDRAEKIREVQARMDLAYRLHNTALSVKVEC